MRFVITFVTNRQMVLIRPMTYIIFIVKLHINEGNILPQTVNKESIGLSMTAYSVKWIENSNF